MAIITGVKFRTPSKVYYFTPGEYEPRYNDHVIVETARGLEYGRVVLPTREVPDEEIKQPLKEVIRIATKEDDEHERENREKEEEAYVICQKKIREHGLEMKLVAAEYTFDNSKLTFYFTADGRVDFRELVKDLASIFRTRIELRQIGVRDETKIIGGIGICGRTLCCHAYLHDFAPVSIKMAKEQNLSLNPTKISGACGRLMCCLKNEAETYEYLNRGLPRKGDGATTPDGLSAEIQSVNILRQTVRVIVDLENDEKEMREYPVSEITFVSRKSRKKPAEDSGVPYVRKVSDEEVSESAEAFFEEQEGEEERFGELVFEEEAAAVPEEKESEKAEQKARRERKPRRKRQNTKSSGGKEEREENAEPVTAAEHAPDETGGEMKNRPKRRKRRPKNGERAEGEKREAAKKAPEGSPAQQEKADGEESGSTQRRHRRKRSHSHRPKNAEGAPAGNGAEEH